MNKILGDVIKVHEQLTPTVATNHLRQCLHALQTPSKLQLAVYQ